MTQAWWQHRQWKFIADMNRDGAVTLSDVRLWAEWLFLLPGDAFIAQIGPTALGRWLELTPASFGSGTSALLSAALWPVVLWVLYFLWGLFLDAGNPTFRAERRERREAEARARRAHKEYERRIYRGRFFRPFRTWLISGLVVVLVAVLSLAFVKDIL